VAHGTPVRFKDGTKVATSVKMVEDEKEPGFLFER